jgi:transcriptional regulator with XRE-family HTH domain
MIRNKKDYQKALRRLGEEEKRLEDHRTRLIKAGLSSSKVNDALTPISSLKEQLIEDITCYERMQLGEVGELRNLHGLGKALVAVRIMQGLIQRELAERLDVHETQVSRDERNEYRGVTMDRAARILDTLGVELRSVFEEPIEPIVKRKKMKKPKRATAPIKQRNAIHEERDRHLL